MGGPSLFPSENLASLHPDDARHWAKTYAELLRTLPPAMSGTDVESDLAERVEFWEARLRALVLEVPHLVSPLHRNRPPRVRALPRAPRESI